MTVRPVTRHSVLNTNLTLPGDGQGVSARSPYTPYFEW